MSHARTRRAPSALARRAGVPLSAALLVAVAWPAGAAAATPGAGVYRDAGAGAVGQRVGLTVEKRHAGAARVASALVSYKLRCEEGSAISGSLHLPGAAVRHGGAFRITSTAGGNFGPEGRINLVIRLGGRFTTATTATGTFSVAAVATDSVIAPARTCETGRVAWTSTLSGRTR